MRELKDQNLLNNYLLQYKIQDLFDTPNLPFRLYEYEPGEIMNYSHSLEKYLKFIVSGDVCLYTIMEDGEQFTGYKGPHCGLLGVYEFCGVKEDNHYHEAITTVHSVELPLSKVRSKLANDNRFLRYLLSQVVKRNSKFADTERYQSWSVEKRLQYYLEYESPNHSFSGVEAMAFYLRCSRSQVQRALKTMTDKGIIVKTGKGKYKLA